MRLFRLLGLLAVVILEVGCGLPDSYLLNYPTAAIFPTGSGYNYFAFYNPDHSVDINVTFQGFDLYYQFYSDASKINNNVQNSTSGLPWPQQLASNGFLPVCRSDDTPPNRTSPAIRIDSSITPAGSEIYVYIIPANQPPSQSSYYTLSSVPNATVELRRDVKDTSAAGTDSGGYKPFSQNSVYAVYPPNYNSNDADISAAVNNASLGSSSTYVYIAMYALSYGTSVTDGTPQTSTPTPLGYLSVPIN